MITENEAEYWPLKVVKKTLILDGAGWLAAWEPGTPHFDIFHDRRGADLYAQDLDTTPYAPAATVGANDWDGTEEPETYLRREFLRWINEDSSVYEANGW